MPLFPDTPDTPDLFEEENHLAGGAINVTEKHLLQPTQVARLLNVKLDIVGKATKRRGVVPRGLASADFPRSLSELTDELTDTQLLFAQHGSNVFKTDGDNTFSPVATSISLYNTPYMGVQGNIGAQQRALFMGTAAPSTNVSLPHGNLIVLHHDVTGAANFTEVNTVRPRSVHWFQSRLWTFNSAHTAHGPDFLAWSAVNDGRNFDHGETVQIDRGSGDEGTALFSIRGDNPRLLLFKERSIHELLPVWETDGFFPATANALDFTKSFLRPIVSGTGCVATRAAIFVPEIQGRPQADILYLSREGVRSLNRSITDAPTGPGRPISFPIEETIDRINWSRPAISKATAFYWDNVAYFAVPVDGSTENNLVLAYDTTKDAWWESDWEVADWAAGRIDTERKFFFLTSATGLTESYDSGANFTDGSHLYETDNGNRDPGRQPVELDLQTRAYTFSNDPQNTAGGLKYHKRWRMVDLAIQSEATIASIAIQYKVDDQENWVTLTTMVIDPEDAFPHLNVPLPFSFDGTKLVRKRTSLHSVPPGYRLQLRFRDQTSFAQAKIHQIFLRANPRNIRFAEGI